MASRPARWCGSCRAVHDGECPNRQSWVKSAVVPVSGRGGRPWRRKRERVFRRDEFLCQGCLRAGVVTVVALSGPLAGICDHIVPLSQGGSDEDENLQTLCRRCSDIKTQRESVFGKKMTPGG